MIPLAAGGDTPIPPEKAIDWVLKHKLDHQVAELGGFAISKLMVMGVIVCGVLAVLALTTNTKSLKPKGLFRNAFEKLLLFVRDGLVRPTMGAKDGDRFVPLFCSLFLFILGCNWLGLVPGAGVVTSNIWATGALALIVTVVSVASAFAFHGVKGIPHLFIPSGLPAVLRPLLFVIEFFGFFVKHGVLALRLFAVMLAGGLVAMAFVGLIYLSQMYLVAPFALAGVVFIYALETLVGFLQAYIFTLLSVLFVGSMVHPDH